MSRLKTDTAAFVASGGIPTRARCFVARTRLDGYFRGILDERMRAIAVWGAAGSGKTSSTAEWARQAAAAGERIAWIAGAESSRRVDLRSIIGKTVRIEHPSIVFVDDVHLIERRAHRDSLSRIVDELPDGVRIVLAGRYNPFPADIVRLRASGEYLEVRDDELAFDVDETMELASRHELALSRRAVEALVQRTGGWATGLVLAMPWLRGTPSPELAVQLFDGDSHAVADYLVTEIVASLPENDRSVLMSAAVETVVPLELAVLLSGREDAGVVLERLAVHNTLISRENGRDAFRYHPVLLAFMQAEARRRGLSASNARHLLASEWHILHGEAVGAVEQAVASGSLGAIERALDLFGLELVLAGRIDPIVSAVNALSETASVSSAALRLLLDAPYFPDSLRARHLFAEAHDRLGTTVVAGQTSPGTDWGTIVDILGAFRVTSAPDLTAVMAALRSGTIAATRRASLPTELLASAAEGWCLSRQGAHAEAEPRLRETAQAAKNAGYDWLFLLASDLVIDAASRTGHWTLVTTFEDQMIGHADAGAGIDRPTARATLVAALRCYERCQPMPLTSLDGIVSREAFGTDLGLFAPAKTMLLLAGLESDLHPRGALSQLTRLMQELGAQFPRAMGASALPLYTHTHALLGRAEARSVSELVSSVLGPDSLESRLLAFAAEPIDIRARSSAESAFEASIENALCWRSTTIVSSWIVLARVADSSGRAIEGDARLMRALRIAEEFRLERAFLHFSNMGGRLLAGRVGRLGDLDEFARHILDGAPPVLSPEASVAPETLTPREHDLLRELPLHQTVTDIARKQSVSPNTVKTHLRNIYQKLGATDRTNAVAIAQRLGLL